MIPTFRIGTETAGGCWGIIRKFCLAVLKEHWVPNTILNPCPHVHIHGIILLHTIIQYQNQGGDTI